MSNPPDEPTLTGYDLHAWQAPPPPLGTTESVLARMQAPIATKTSARSRSARTISAVAGATLVAAAAVAALMVTHHDAPPIVALPSPSLVAPPVAQPPSPSPSPSLAVGGSPQDDARVQALEKRVLELEVTVEELRTQLAQVRTPAPRPVPTPRPVPSLELLPPADHPLHVKECDPFVSPHGCPVDPLPPTPTPPCDADALKQDGDRAANMNDYPSALRAYEAVLACKPDDAFVQKLTFMAACMVHDVAKVRAYYARLDVASQGQLAPICLREGIDPATPADATTGLVNISTVPIARIWVDGIDTKRDSPASISLPVGKHKITLQLGGDKYTYPLTVRAGETVAFNKDLR